MRFDVVSFGSAVVDAFVRTWQSGGKIEYKAGSKILVDDLRFDVGGGATNTAVAFARLGLKAGCVCNVGDDNNGDEVLDCLKREGVSFLGKRVKGATGYSVVLDSKDKSRTILVYKGVGSCISSGDIGKFDADWFFLGSVLGKSFETGKKLAFRMKKAGAKVVFNPSEYLVGAKNIGKLLAISDVVILNREEFDAVRRKYGKGFCSGVVVVTDKNKRVVAYTTGDTRFARGDTNALRPRGYGKSKISHGDTRFARGRVYYLKPHKVKVVERTGAGDAFVSGFVAGQIVGWSIERCLKLGLAESEAVIRYFGAKNNLIRRKLK